jgi:hypothetical protein
MFITQMKNEIIKMKSDEESSFQMQNLTGIPSNSRIVKPIRGGAGKRLHTPRGLTQTQSVLLDNIISMKKN